MEKVYQTADLMTAHFVKGLLVAEGIPAVVSGDTIGFYNITMPVDGMGPTVSVINEEDYPRAREVIEEFERGERPGPADGPLWTCPSCGEQLAAQFTTCWKCETPRPDGE